MYYAPYDLLDVNPSFGGVVKGERFSRHENTMWHVKTRVKQRYLRDVPVEEVKYWNNQVLKGDAEWCCDNDDLCSEYIVYNYNKPILVLFDVKRWTIVTALPSERLGKYIFGYVEQVPKKKARKHPRRRKTAKRVGLAA